MSQSHSNFEWRVDTLKNGHEEAANRRCRSYAGGTPEETLKFEMKVRRQQTERLEREQQAVERVRIEQ